MSSKAPDNYRRPIFPFSALVGQPRLKAALLANAVDPSIGGLLIRGEKGTGKTTVVRALAELLPPLQAVAGCPYRCDPSDPDTPHTECREKIAQAAQTAEATQAAQGTGGSAPQTSGGPNEGASGGTGVGAAADGAELHTVESPAPLVELPLNATEERVAGTVHLEETLRTGERHFEPGLLAAAHRGILYIDEVNLLEDHLVDLILDAAATGLHRVEREGFSLEHPAAFQLIGTMNPEEGELRPQFIDRFGLCISVKGESEPELRKEIARRRIAFERSPRELAAGWQAEQERLSQVVAAARAVLSTVELSDELWDMIVAYAARGGVQGHRADIVMAKTAATLAALNGRGRVRQEDVQEAARLALPHRLSGRIDDTPESSADRLEELIGGQELPDLDAPPESTEGEIDRRPPSFDRASSFEGRTERSVDPLDELQVPGSAAAGSIVFDFLKKKSPH